MSSTAMYLRRLLEKNPPVVCFLFCPCGLIGVNPLGLGLCWSHSHACIQAFLESTRIGAWSAKYMTELLRAFARDYRSHVSKEPDACVAEEVPPLDPMRPLYPCETTAPFVPGPFKRPAGEELVDERPCKIQRPDVEIVSVTAEAIPCPFAGLSTPMPPGIAAHTIFEETDDLYE
jgi:hypothetical protein